MNEEPLPWEMDMPAAGLPTAPDSGSRRGRKAAEARTQTDDDPAGVRGIVSNKTPRTFASDLKLKIILESISKQKSQNELGRLYNIPQSLISVWTKEALEVLRSHVEKPQNKTGSKTKAAKEIEEFLDGEAAEAMIKLRETLTQCTGINDYLLRRAGCGGTNTEKG